MIFTSAKPTMQVGDAAPDFTLPSGSGENIRLYDLLQKSCVVLYFYPKDETQICTAEACLFRDQYEVFREAGAEVVGISSDSAESHQQFSQHHSLPFILLSDKGNAVRTSYGVPKTLMFLPGRVTYVIDRAGIIRHIFSSQLQYKAHVEAALRVVRQIQAEEAEKK